MDDFFAKRFDFASIPGPRLLAVGLGGGSDAISAFAVSQQLPGREVVYANTKTGGVGPSLPARHDTPHVVRLMPAGRDAQHVGRTRIDRALPRGPRDSPWVVRLEDDADAVVAGEIASLGFDGFVGVDTGGDSVGQVRNRPGRDQRMLAVLAAARGSADVPLWLLILGPGSDGQSSEAELREAFAARAALDEYAGWFPLDPFLPVFRTFAPELDETRTPRIILAAEDDTLATDRQNRVIVPRGKRPPIPRPWLRH